MRSVAVGEIEIEYTDTGSGPVVVFVHGAYVTGALWDDVARRLFDSHRCIAPTWPFGAQSETVGAGVDLSVRSSGRRIVGLLEALDLSDVTLVANDTGGGIVLAALGNAMLDWDRVSRLVFTNCDSFEHFPPKSFAPLVRLCALNQAAGAIVLKGLTTGPGLKVFSSAVTQNGIDAARRPAIFGGFLTSASVRREAARFTADLKPTHTMAAVNALKLWKKPVLIAWGTSDKLFPLSHAHRLAETFPAAVVRPIEDSSTYVMLDRPDESAEAIREFVAGPKEEVAR
ncbi:pimeloyl-ACP methyl ester carboxylesterase [Mycobacterium sp. OAS707]|uniref:alpha/beta fold hydrolase n=1 Tax=Mycobacterium sp. OAS707 TaxID=2663822 RepID=UPI001A0C987E|nr:pimeloyl-ACP methyl ester carboxylesterase [Mycobacterium sp. OAS707]